MDLSCRVWHAILCWSSFASDGLKLKSANDASRWPRWRRHTPSIDCWRCSARAPLVVCVQSVKLNISARRLSYQRWHHRHNRSTFKYWTRCRIFNTEKYHHTHGHQLSADDNLTLRTLNIMHSSSLIDLLFFSFRHCWTFYFWDENTSDAEIAFQKLIPIFSSFFFFFHFLPDGNKSCFCAIFTHICISTPIVVLFFWKSKLLMQYFI